MDGVDAAMAAAVADGEDGRDRRDPSAMTLMTIAKDVGALREVVFAIFEERDCRYRERFEAQEKAVSVALAAVETRMIERLEAARREHAAALAANDKAIAKQEIAAEKRFEAVNEFRAQLSDQAATFMPRAEYDRAHLDLGVRVENGDKALAEKLEQAIRTLENRMIQLQTQVSGVEAVVR